MAYRIRYQLNIDYLPQGVGPMVGFGWPPGGTQTAPSGAQLSASPASGAQTLEFNNQTSSNAVGGSGTVYPGGNALTAADITTLLSAMSTDLSTQMNAALGRLAQFPNGGT